MVTAGASWESVSKESTNSAMMRKMRQGSSRTKPKVFWFMCGEGSGKGRRLSSCQAGKVEGSRFSRYHVADDILEICMGAVFCPELFGGGFGVAGVSRAGQAGYFGSDECARALERDGECGVEDP